MKWWWSERGGKILAAAVFCGIFGWRWMSLDSELPGSWTPETELKYTALILEEVEHTESKTIITQGIWRIEMWGHHSLSLGQRYAFVGRVKKKVLLGKTSEIIMVDPTFEKVARRRLRVGEKVIIGLSQVRERMVDNLSRWLPEPHSSLSAGILLGVQRRLPYVFYQQLVKSGTLHIVAASGYNINVAAASVMGVMSVMIGRGGAIVGGLGAIALYVGLAGGGAAVVRAGLMGGLALIAYYWGRPAEARRLLWVAAAAMLITRPILLLNVGFQLSVSATAGLLYFEPWLKKKIQSLELVKGLGRYLEEYLYPTLAATLATAPIIYLTFGRISWVSPLVNMLVLPLVPMIMFLSGMAVGVGSLIPELGQGVSYILYVPLELMVWLIGLFG